MYSNQTIDTQNVMQLRMEKVLVFQIKMHLVPTILDYPYRQRFKNNQGNKFTQDNNDEIKYFF